MKRTYKSKKDTSGALDPKDVIISVDNKVSAFDAFYIKNIKQIKREQSCVGSTYQDCSTRNKVRKRKYVKRLVQDIDSSPNVSSKSTFLTPDKSIRVNKVFDAFDQLLNSTASPKCKTANNAFDNLLLKQ